MELWYLFVLIALLLAVFLVGTQITFMIRSRRARKSREKLRDRTVDRALASRLFVGGRVVGNEVPPLSSQSAEMQGDNRDAGGDEPVEPTLATEVSFSDHSQDEEIMTLRSKLQEQDETVSQLQQVLEELSTTTATRESVNFLQKQLLTARTTMQQQEAELKQLRREVGQRRPPAAAVAAHTADEQASKLLMEQLDQSNQLNHVLKEKLAEQFRCAEIGTEELQQNALESNRLRTELERLRTELESVRTDRSIAKARLAELQVRVDEQQNVLDELISLRTVSDVLTLASQPDENERSLVRPAYVSAEEHDNLKVIKGIGPVMEQRLRALGVTTFRQLAECNEQDIEAIATAIGTFPGHIKRDDWVGKARELAAFSKDPA